MFSVPVGPSICRWLCYVATRGVENVDKYVFDKRFRECISTNT
jgi:hypothetical protein